MSAYAHGLPFQCCRNDIEARVRLAVDMKNFLLLLTSATSASARQFKSKL